jgi:hypothetical protein
MQVGKKFRVQKSELGDERVPGSEKVDEGN